MRGNLTVRVDDGFTSQMVTAAASDLQFRKVAPGGFHSGSFRLNMPRSAFRDLGPADRVYVYDSRTGRTVMEGFIENPGRSAGAGGEAFDLAFMGTMVLSADEAHQFIYRDTDTGGWERANGGAASAGTAQSADPDPASAELSAANGLLMQFNPGQPVGTGSKAPMRYVRLESAGFEVGAVKVTVRSGKVDAGYVAQVGSGTGVGGSGSYNDLGTPGQIGTTAATASLLAGAVGAPPLGDTRVVLRLKRTGGATNVTDDDTWSYFYDLAVLGHRIDRYGVRVASMTTADYVLAGWVAEDLLARALPSCNPKTARIAAGTFEIDQLAYPEAVRASQVLDDLLAVEPALHWGIGASSPHDDRCQFWLDAWPTTPRYIVSTSDGWSETGSDADLCNRIAVNYTDAAGVERTEVVTAVVPALGGRTKDAEAITLPEGRGSQSTAQRIGAAALDDLSRPPRAGHVSVARRIVDLYTGNLVSPWELEPGHLCRVREIGEDLRITEMEYRDSDCSATLTLGTPVLTTEQRIARMPNATGGFL